MADPARSVAFDLESLLGDLEPIQHAAGAAGKTAFGEVAEATLGPDRALSGLGRRVPLNAGYDLGNPVILNMRPKGLVILAADGRRRTKRITPRRRRGKQALTIPGVGLREWSTSKPSRGVDIVERTRRRWEDTAPDAVDEAVADMIRKAGFA